MKILVADDHTLFRESLVLTLARLGDKPTILQASSGEEAIDTSNLHNDLSLLLLDIDMPGMSGLEVIRILHKSHPTLPIVIISANDEYHYITKAIDLGAKGFIPKTTSTDVTLSALQLVQSGGVYLPPELLSKSPRATYASKDNLLTPRQMEILHLLQKGDQNKNIAFQLELSPSTVKVHIRRIFTSLGATNRTEAVNNAIEMGIL